jgi:hypothetical protein
MLKSNNPKLSSRSGRFKKKLVSEKQLIEEAPAIQKTLDPFCRLLIDQQLSPVDFVASYILIYLSHRYPVTWACAHQKANPQTGPQWNQLPFNFSHQISSRLDPHFSVRDIFAHFSLKSTPASVNRAIVLWGQEQYKLELMLRVPVPKEVLNQQKWGKRCVTTILDERLSTYILGERDPLSFTLHDLIHADHFYHHPQTHKGQLSFYGLLDTTFSYFDLSHKKFQLEFEYLISDMNAYGIHLLKCLKSAMIFHFNEDYFNQWQELIKAPEALSLLNTHSYESTTMDEEILTWMDQFRLT